MTHRPAVKARLRLRLVTLSAALVALGMVGTPAADAAKKKCTKGKEEKGCTLKAGSSFSNVPKTPTLLVNASGSGIVIRVAASSCSTDLFPNRPFSATGKAKVGKTFNVNKKVTLGRSQSGSTYTATLKGTVKINSAQKATVKATFARQVDDSEGCSDPISVTLKRKSSG
jgi:hypothetical protein